MPNVVFNTRPKTRPQIWDHIKEHKTGWGGMLDLTMLDANRNFGILMKGCPIYLDADTMDAHVVKSAEVLSGGTTSAPHVNKDHLFIVGDFVFVNSSAVTITAIDESNEDYDVLTLSAACGGATEGAIIEQAAEAGASPSKLYAPNCLLGTNYNIEEDTNIDLVFRIDEWVRRVMFAYPLSDTTVASLAPNIIIK